MTKTWHTSHKTQLTRTELSCRLVNVTSTRDDKQGYRDSTRQLIAVLEESGAVNVLRVCVGGDTYHHGL